MSEEWTQEGLERLLEAVDEMARPARPEGGEEVGRR